MFASAIRPTASRWWCASMTAARSMPDRVIDLSWTAAWKLGYLGQGSTLVEVESCCPASTLAAARRDVGAGSAGGTPPPVAAGRRPDREDGRCRAGAIPAAGAGRARPFPATGRFRQPRQRRVAARATGARTRRPCRQAGGAVRPASCSASSSVPGRMPPRRSARRATCAKASAWRRSVVQALVPSGCAGGADYNSTSPFLRFFNAIPCPCFCPAAAWCRPRAALPTTIPVPAVSARAWLLMDYATGQVLAAQEADARLEPASLTKVMTTYLVAEALAQKTLSLQQPVTVSERAWRTQGSRSFVPVNKGVSVDDLFKGMVIQSGNDASVALAEAIGGSEDAFAAMMNRTAQRMGLKDTNFLNASGYFEGPGAESLLDRARPRQTRRGADPRPSGNPCPACDEGIHLQRHPPAQPQPPAVGRSDRGWPQDRTFQRRRLLPDRHREARPAAADFRGARHGIGGCARQGFAQPAQLGLQRIRSGQGLRQGPGDFAVERSSRACRTWSVPGSPRTS
jgi:hypothetical protein